MKSTLSIGAKLKLLELRWMLENNMIKDYSDFKEIPIGSGQVSFKYTALKPIKRFKFSELVNFEFNP